MSQRFSNQRGISIGPVMLIIMLVVFFATILLKTLPSYMEFWTVKSVMNSVEDRPDEVRRGPAAIRRLIMSQLQINQVSSLEESAFVIQPSPGGRGAEISVSYVVQKPMFLNIDVLMNFEHTVVVEGQ